MRWMTARAAKVTVWVDSFVAATAKEPVRPFSRTLFRYATPEMEARIVASAAYDEDRVRVTMDAMEDDPTMLVLRTAFAANDHAAVFPTVELTEY